MVIFAVLPTADRYASAQDRIIPQAREQLQLSFAPLVKQVAPAVVNIYTKRTVTQSVANPFMNDPFFAPFFGNGMFGNRMRRQVENSLGSGVIIEPDGMVVTNAHVVKNADEITVILNDGREFDAELILRDEPSDLALLKFDTGGENVPYAQLRPSESLQVGDLVLAIGNPFGVGQTVTSGIVSALARSTLSINDFNFFIQTDAAINPGNSGGPLVSLDGGVVGINTAIFSKTGGSLGIGFAVPSEMVASIVAAAKMGQKGDKGIIRPWLGVTAQNVTAEIANSLGIDRPRGVLIAQLHPASPLSKAGIKVGDLVTAINGKEIRDASELKFRMATVPIGHKADVDVQRQDKPMSFKVAAIAPPDDPPREETPLSGPHPLNGAVVANINPALSVELGNLSLDEGVVVVGIARGARAGRVVKPGDILVEINGKEIENVGDVEKALKRGGGQGWEIILNSNGQNRRVLVR